jgi:cytochrome c
MRLSAAFLLGILGLCHGAQAQSVARGQALFESRCVACHSLDANRVGPALRGVLGRTAGKADDYFYSKAMAAATHVWDAPKLKAWLTNPEDLVPGQAMNYRLDIPQDREDVVAYLASVSAAPTIPQKANP